MSMFDHISLGMSDLFKAGNFYDAVMGVFGYSRQFEERADGDIVAIGYGVDKPVFWICAPLSGTAAAAPGTHVAFKAETKEQVHQFYEQALAHGGSDDGAPGPRPEYHENYFAAFVRDPEGHKIEAVFGNG